MRNLILILFLLSLIFAVGQPASADTTIRWWQFWTDPGIKPTVQQLVDEFEAANPGITVELTDLTWANGHEKLAIAFASGSSPDVVELGSDWIAQFADGEFLADLSSDVPGDSAEYQGWGMARYQDKIWAYPWILGTRVLFVNLQLCSKAGLEESSCYPTHWHQLVQSAKAVHELGGGVYGWGSNTAEKHRLYKKFLPFFWSAGAQLFSEDGAYCLLPSVKGISALKMYQILHQNFGYVADQRGIEDAFLNDKIGFIISGDWLLKRIAAEKPNLSFGTTLIPGSNLSMDKPPFPGKSFLGGEFLAVSKNCQNKEVALKLIRFITSPENQIRFCKANKSANPSSKTAQRDDYFMTDVNLQTFIRQARLAEHPPVDPDWVQMETEIELAVEKTLFQGIGPATALREAALNIKRIREAR